MSQDNTSPQKPTMTSIVANSNTTAPKAAPAKPAAKKASPAKKPAARKTTARSTAKAAARKTTTAAKTATKSATKASKNFAASGQQFADTGLQTFNGLLNTANSFFQQQTNQTEEAMSQNYQEINNIVKGNIDSTINAFNTLNNSYQQISQAMFSLGQNIIENNLAATKAIVSSKNLQDAVEIQNKTAKSNIEQALAQSAKISQMGVDAANKAIQPVQQQAQKNMDQLFKKAA